MKNITLSIRTSLFIAICIFATSSQLFAQDDPVTVFADGFGETEMGAEDLKLSPVIKTISVPVTNGYLKVAYEQLDETAELSLISMSGKKVHASNVKGDREQKGTLTIPVNNLSAGVYIVRLKNAAYNITKRIVIRN